MIPEGWWLSALQRAEEIYKSCQTEKDITYLYWELVGLVHELKLQKQRPEVLEQVETLLAGVKLLAVGKNIEEPQWFDYEAQTNSVGS